MTALVLLHRNAAAQATPYVPVDDPVYAYINALQARGGLRSLWAFERPYTSGELAKALSTDSISLQFPHWRAAIEHAIERTDVRDTNRTSAFRTGITLEAFITAQTTGRRDLVHDDIDPEGGVHPGFAGRLVAGTGNIVAAGRLIADTRLRKDPEFAGTKDRPLIGRPEEGYLLISPRFVQFSAGRLARDWGPASVGGLQIGTAPATYDHLYARLGGSRIRLSAMLAKLSDYRYGSDSTAQRYLSAHRLAFKFGSLEIGGTESMVYGGPGESASPPLSNPLVVFDIAQYNENATGNVQVGVDALWRTRVGQFGIQLMLDDYQVDECTPLCEEPTSYGESFVVEGIPLGAANRGFASYTRLSNLAYRTASPHETYSHLDVGLGRAFSDYEEWRLGVETALLPIAPLRFYWAYRHQGKGDYRQPFPTPAEYASTPGFLVGPVTTTTRYGVSGAAVTRLVDIDGDIGLNARAGMFQRPGETAFVGRLRIAVRPPWLWRSFEDAP